MIEELTYSIKPPGPVENGCDCHLQHKLTHTHYCTNDRVFNTTRCVCMCGDSVYFFILYQDQIVLVHFQ